MHAYSIEIHIFPVMGRVSVAQQNELRADSQDLGGEVLASCVVEIPRIRM
jgi:hypothetical protein